MRVFQQEIYTKLRQHHAFRHTLRQALTPDAPCECSVSQSARNTHSHTGCVCALRSLGHGCVQEVKNNVNLFVFSHKPLVSCLRSSSVVTMGIVNLNFSVLFLFPSYRDSDLYLHYMTDRLERFDLKTSKLDLLKEKKTLTSWMPLG